MRVLALVVLVAGCGRLGFEGDEPGGNDMVGVDDEALVAPGVCEETGPLGQTASADVDLAIANTPTGVSVFFTQATGSALSGFDLAADRTPSAVQEVHSGTFDRVSAAYVDGRLVVTGRSGTRALIYDAPQPLAAAGCAEMANYWGNHIAKTAIVHAGTDRVMAASCTLVALHAWDSAWAGAETTYSQPVDESTHVDVAQLGTRAISVAESRTGCHFDVFTDRTTSTSRSSSTHCARARMATRSDERVAMAFEGLGTIGLVVDDAMTVTAANAMAIAAGDSPRVLEHGGQFWLAYRDENQNLTIGVIDSDGMVVTHPLGIPVEHDAYELAIYDGAPWLFSVDTTQIVGRRLCTTPRR